MHLRWTVLVALTISVAIGTDSFAATHVITFDNLPDTPLYDGLPIPDGYEGLNWDNFYYFTSTLGVSNPSGYVNGLVSGTNVAYNGGAQPAFLSSSTPFDVNSVYLTGAWNDGLSVQVIGYRGGSVVYDNSFVVNSTAPTLISLSYLAVDQVRFVSSGGTPNPDFLHGSGEHFAMDDLSITVPEPALSLVGALAALALAFSRSRAARATRR